MREEVGKAMPFIASSLSVRGLGHVRSNTPCQDSSAVLTLDNGTMVVGTVADGGGSARLSQIGSNLAAQVTLSALALLGESIDLHTLQEEAWREICTDVVEDVRRTILEEAQIMGLGPGAAPHFGTTLLAFMATRSRLAALQVGDGFIVTAGPVSGGNGGLSAIAFKPERGEYVGEVVWVTSSAWEKDMKCRLFDGPFDFVCVASDGLEKVAVRQIDNEPHEPYFAALRNGTRQAADPTALASLIELVLKDKRLDQKTDDDKSMVLVGWADRVPPLAQVAAK